jgi:hypothetical protein
LGVFVGLLAAAFFVGQFLTSAMWVRASGVWAQCSSAPALCCCARARFVVLLCPSVPAVCGRCARTTESGTLLLLRPPVLQGAASDRFGRKVCVLVSFMGAAVATVVFGTAHSYAQAITARFLAGALNGNMVGRWHVEGQWHGEAEAWAVLWCGMARGGAGRCRTGKGQGA